MQSPPVPRPPGPDTRQAGDTSRDDERRRRFEALYQACHAPVLGYVLRRTQSPHDAADVIAETFLTAWRRLDEIPTDPQARLWLYGVARRMLANHHRGERRRSALADRLRADLAATWPARPGAQWQDTREDSGELAGVTAAFGRLPEPQRELLALNAWEDLDYGQIAVVLGCSRNAVRIRLHRARRQFAAELARIAGRPAPSDVPEPRRGIR